MEIIFISVMERTEQDDERRDDNEGDAVKPVGQTSLLQALHQQPSATILVILFEDHKYVSTFHLMKVFKRYGGRLSDCHTAGVVQLSNVSRY